LLIGSLSLGIGHENGLGERRGLSSMEQATIFKSLLTMAAVIGAGWLGRRSKILSVENTEVLSKFVYYFGLPALFFIKIARLNLSDIPGAVILGSLGPIGALLLLLGLCRALKILSRDIFIMLGISVAFGSNAFFGIPFFEALYGEWGLDLAVVTAALLGVFGIVASLSFFEYATRQGRETAFLVRVLRSPLILSILAGSICSVGSIRSDFLFDALTILGQTAPGVAVFMLGMFIHDHFSFALLKKSARYSAFRLLALPLATAVVVFFLPTSDASLKEFLFLQSGIPAAISIAVFAQRYKYMMPELTGVVVATSLMSFPALTLLYFLVHNGFLS